MVLSKVTVPDFGDVQEIVVVEVYVSVGDSVTFDESLIALESEKAVMDIPAPIAGIVHEIFVQENDVVKSGAAILSLTIEDDSTPIVLEKPEDHDKSPKQPKEENVVAEIDETIKDAQSELYHATPSLRAFAREMDVDLSSLVGTGAKGRILKKDVEMFLEETGTTGSAISKQPVTHMSSDQVPEPMGEDFSRFGPVTSFPLPRIKKISGPHLQKSWRSIPHVTQFDEADINELEVFRNQLKEKGGKQSGYSPLVFIIKAAAAALKTFPLFNSSLQESGDAVTLKNYYHIGIAVDTENGLMVPVIRDVDKKGISEIADELATLSQAARESKLTIDQIQGASFTISSLGGIGGTAFTPIVNAPQVAILGLSRNYMKPVWDREQEKFLPRLTLPFSVSYDHRVVDGAEGARFCRALAGYIEDLRTILL